MPSAQTSTLKPAGTLSLSTGSSFAARPVRCGAKGCRGELACSAERPCCHDGGADGACWASAAVLNAARIAADKALYELMSPPFLTAWRYAGGQVGSMLRRTAS